MAAVFPNDEQEARANAGDVQRADDAPAAAADVLPAGASPAGVPPADAAPADVAAAGASPADAASAATVPAEASPSAASTAEVPSKDVLPSDASLEEIRAYFACDRFATRAGCRIVDGARGRSECEMQLTSDHRNAMGNVMGGAIFTLADFALAVACNAGEAPTVSIQSNITYFAKARGNRLVARAQADRSGRHVGYYTVEVVDELGTRVAVMTAVCCR